MTMATIERTITDREAEQVERAWGRRRDACVDYSMSRRACGAGLAIVHQARS